MITFKTNVGDFTVSLDFDKAPITAKNFLNYAKDEFYNGTVFHRVINDFMVQGGGMDKNMPVGVIQNGTTSKQKMLKGTISNIANKIKRNKIKPPTNIIIGRVVDLSDIIGWKK